MSEEGVQRPYPDAAAVKRGEPQPQSVLAARRGVPALSVASSQQLPPPSLGENEAPANANNGAGNLNLMITPRCGQQTQTTTGAPLFATPSTAATASTSLSSVVFSAGTAPSGGCRHTPLFDYGREGGAGPTSPETPWHIRQLPSAVLGHHGAISTPSAAATCRHSNADQKSYAPQTHHHHHAVKVGSTAMSKAQYAAHDFTKHESYPTTRLVQTFSAKLILEVFGGGGAIWGFSEVVNLRRTETQLFWRMNASVVAAIFAVRWLMQIRDSHCRTDADGSTKINANLREGTMKRLLQIFSARMVLEVCGGGGAIWGFSEVCALRVPATQEFWRYNASVVAFIFCVRWCLQVHEYALEHDMLRRAPDIICDDYEHTPVLLELEPNTERTALTSKSKSTNPYDV